ncbi:MAG: antA/AntB antirepressor family protein [Fusobacteriaceae bacterium]
MKEIIKIEEKEGKKLVNLRELHEFLESKQEFANWIKNRIENYDFLEEKDFLTILSKTNGRPLKEYFGTLEMSKEISMVENNSKGKEARKYFIECETKLRSPKIFSLEESLELSLKLLKDNKVLELENKKQNERLENLTHTGKLFTASELAVELGLKSATALNLKLEEMGFQKKVGKTWLTCSKYSGVGYVSVKQEERKNGEGKTYIIYDRKFTEKGREYLLNVFKTQQILSAI